MGCPPLPLRPPPSADGTRLVGRRATTSNGPGAEGRRYVTRGARSTNRGRLAAIDEYLARVGRLRDPTAIPRLGPSDCDALRDVNAYGDRQQRETREDDEARREEANSGYREGDEVKPTPFYYRDDDPHETDYGRSDPPGRRVLVGSGPKGAATPPTFAQVVPWHQPPRDGFAGRVGHLGACSPGRSTLPAYRGRVGALVADFLNANGRNPWAVTIFFVAVVVLGFLAVRWARRQE